MLLRSVAYRLESEWFKRIPASPAPRSGPRLLHLGCGDVHFDNWINADLPRFPFFRPSGFRKPDWSLDVQRRWACQDNFWHGVFTEHMLEHLDYAQARFALSQCLRTMAEGATIRIVVPDLKKYVAFYNGQAAHQQFAEFSCGAVAISNIAQNFGHKSLWDGFLLTASLKEIGFADAREMSFGEGRDPRIIKDRADRQWESLYVEAIKP
jgi:hypothetical protein